MRISDIINASSGESSRFQRWLAFILKWECKLDEGSLILPENDHDGQGLTFAGLTETSDNLPTDIFGNVTATPQWIVARYMSGYWNAVLAGTMPGPVGEVTANFAVNDGVSEAGTLLQKSIIAMGVGVIVDGVIGPRTMTALWSLMDDRALARVICSEAITHYHQIVAANPSRAEDLQGWINRTDNLLTTFCS